MTNRPRFFHIAVLLVGLLVTAVPVPVHADLIFTISVDSSSLNGQSGYLDFQFNPGGSNAESATATVTGFQTVGGLLSQPAQLTGDATGSLPGTLTLVNGTIYNDIFQEFTFGSGFTLDVTLSGQAINSPGSTEGSAFALSLYAADQITPLLTTDPNGSVATINLNANGTTSVETFAQSPTNPTPAASVTQPNSVPEPPAIIMIISALPLGSVIWWNRLRRGSSMSSLAH